MADEVPVCDVLCEAMEYLSKLGSNLRARSENLKEKRIRKDKLKNHLAVQKAADKVLLICELSKKSLENVECGVRKVLSLMSSRQEDDLGSDALPEPKTSTVAKSEKYRYFKFRSHKLKISKRVPVKHYMSVKVLARKMSTSTLNKYPNYYNRKLYQRRNREHKLSTSEKENPSHNSDSQTNPKSIDNSLCEGKDNLSNTVICAQQDSSSINKNEFKEEISKPRKMSDSFDSPEQISISKQKNQYNSKKTNKSNLKDILSDSESNSKDVTQSSGKSEEESDTDSSKLTTKSSLKKNRIIDDDSSDNCNEPKTVEKEATSSLELECSNKEKPLENINDTICSKSSSPTLTSKRVKSTDGSPVIKAVSENILSQTDLEHETCENKSDIQPDSVKPLIKCVNITKLLKPDVLQTKENSHKKTLHKENNDAYSKDKENKNVGEKKESKSKSDRDIQFWSQKRKEVSAFVSKKFCVKLSRLPDLTDHYLKIHNLNKITQNGKVLIELIERFDYISKNKKQIMEDISNSPGKLNGSLDDINILKHALLNDSDSEKEINTSPLLVPEVLDSGQNAILDSSHKDKESFCKNSTSKESDKLTLTSNEKNNSTEKVKNALLNDSDSDLNKSEPDTKKTDRLAVSTEVKRTLLAESDSDNVENTTSEQVNDELPDESVEVTINEANAIKENVDKTSNSVTPLAKDNLEHSQREVTPDNVPNKEPDKSGKASSHSKKKVHKRKHIMESMHAKKMLLTYSSSSDTEDEQLKNALKEIKNSLLKGASSSDDEKKASHGPLSSDTEEDIIIKRVKRKRKSIRISEEDSENSSLKEQGSKDNVKNDSNSDTNSKTSKKMGRSRAQPGGSSQNSDSQDPNDKDVEGLTSLNSLTRARRRRDSTSTNNTDSNSVKKIKVSTKTSLISEENMLKAESSSDAEAGSAVDSDPEELPSVALSGLNGSGVDHLAKDDLLDESDTSVSHKEDSDGIKKNDDSDEDAVKSKRRKAHLISSDSEVGSSRKKNTDVKVSDFEDSEDESSEPAKKNKRKKKAEDSDASVGSSSSNDESKKKRRRIKQINDSDCSGSDTENEGRNKHGRKNIRKVMGKNQLEEATKKAAREEKERIARIAERQKLYNNLEFDESGKPDEVVLEKVVLDFDPETKEPLIQVDRGLVKKLKPHQANGIKFMWDACFESVKRIKKDRGSGCILAHCMGLGKTLQVVSLTHTLLTHSDLTNVNRVLVVCPLSTVLNWVNEFKMWLKHSETDYDVDVYELSRHKQNSERAFQLQQWFDGGGVCVLGYEMFRNLSADNSKKFKKKMLRSFQESLVDPGPDLVVCDEGHLLKNEKTSLSQSMNRVKTRRRIVLTGTPLQNNLKEYYCMVQFVKPNLLGKYNEYLNRFVNPITNGQYTDSTEHDIRIMKRRSHVLHKMLDGAVQRRDYGVLAPFLPPKHEYVLFITLTDVQIKLYQHYLDNYSRRPLPGKSSGFLFPDFQSLQRIWTHPLVLKYNSERYEIMQQKKREREEEDSEGSLVDFIDDDSTPDESSTEESSDDLSDVSDDSRKKSKKKKSPKKSKGKDSKAGTRRGTRANPVEMEEDEQNEVVELKNENPTEWWIKLVDEEELEDMRNSHKLVLLFDILRQCEAIGDKLLVFSQSLYSLDLIEHFLGKVDEATQEGRIDEKLGGHVGSWSPGVDYFRLDGSTSCENRSIWCKNFNREDNPRARLFLISTRAGGLGINLVAANRVVIFDVSWNPSHDVQSIFRVYRFGQKKPCYIYRFLAMGTMEEKIYERQVTKQAISKRVIDEQQIDRHYAENDLAELYKFEARPPLPRPLPPLPKDRLFAEMLREHEAQIYKYHEHDSLLENKEEETLSEEERKAAWEDFENEKNRPPPAPFPSAWPMHNGMVPGLLAQQQQQLAYAALAAMLRKDMPNINDNQIRDMLPLIYNANPALMQKMSEIYKYSQPGMMNPAMMNPVMNAGSGGAGMGGTSGLQYEPPWQRQHQQQQQMRLQQLMQQNQMGAKYYAGGLGSRDPVAMALQQQRAREIMSGERRPRGRPPLSAAPPAPADVVNLDSD